MCTHETEYNCFVKTLYVTVNSIVKIIVLIGNVDVVKECFIRLFMFYDKM